MTYSVKFKEKMVQRLLQGGNVTALAHETGVATTTLYKWRRRSLNGEMTSKPDERKKGKKRAALTPLDKMRMIVEFEGLSAEETGAWLRSHGLHRADIDAWLEQVSEGLERGQGRKQKQEWAKEKRRLERELRRKDAALAETTALLVLSKKAEALWGGEDGGTTPN